jgi:hypothetical protein
MTESLPAYVSITFILTTFLTVGFLLYGVRRSVLDTVPAKIFIGVIAFWLLFQAVMAMGGFYTPNGSFPPRIVLFGIFPALLLIAAYFVFFRNIFVERLPLSILTLLHIIRIPVEFVLLWLFQGGLVPQLMTFEGRNFDILSGMTAPIVAWLAFRDGKVNTPLLVVWNLLALGLLVNIVATAILSVPSPIQRYGLDQPNVAIMYFPYNWLPTVVVPIVLFSHLAALWKVAANKTA